VAVREIGKEEKPIEPEATVFALPSIAGRKH
jgi:hypothetical protein